MIKVDQSTADRDACADIVSIDKPARHTNEASLATATASIAEQTESTAYIMVNWLRPRGTMLDYSTTERKLGDWYYNFNLMGITTAPSGFNLGLLETNSTFEQVTATSLFKT